MAMFVSVENGFRKTIYTLPCVWLCMENLVKRKIISVDRKINPSNPENDFRSYFTFKAFPEFLSSTWSDSPSASALPYTPTRGRQSSTPHAGTGSRFAHTPMSSAAVFPSTPVGFIPFLFISHSTSPPPTSSSACTQSTKAKPTLMSVKPISPPISPIRRSHAAGETLLPNPPSTIPDPYPFKPIALFFSSLTQPHLQDHAVEIVPHHH